MKKSTRNVLLGILTLLIITIGGFLIWAMTPSQPQIEAYESITSAQTDVNDHWLVFSPQDTSPKTGLILYPGGRVDYRAYAPVAKAISEAGFTVVLVPMPLNFAFLGINRADDVMAAFPEISTWAVGGHSLGGAMAAEYAMNNLSLIDGLVLWASYPAENTDFSSTNLPVLSIYASNDGLAGLEDITNSQERLPDQTIYVEIKGGNHAGFGWYGPQKGDGTPEISKISQQEQILTASIAFLSSLDN
jgi:pimeloyl-ACP methyl ester carboxylesterase